MKITIDISLDNLSYFRKIIELALNKAKDNNDDDECNYWRELYKETCLHIENYFIGKKFKVSPAWLNLLQQWMNTSLELYHSMIKIWR